MDDLYADRIQLGEPLAGVSGSRAADGDARLQTNRQLQMIMQRLAPNLHHWDHNVIFSIDRLKQDTGWEAEYTFPAMVEATWDWMQRESLSDRLDFDFDVEDRILKQLGI